MLRQIAKLLKKHLDFSKQEFYKAHGEYDISSVWTPYDVIEQWPDGHQVSRLARELSYLMRGQDITKLARIPGQKETERFLAEIYPSEAGDTFETLCERYSIPFHARCLRRWLYGMKAPKTRLPLEQA